MKVHMLTTLQLDAFDRQLAERAHDLSQRLSSLRSQSVDEDIHDVGDLKDVADDAARDLVDDDELRRHVMEMREIRLARERILAGTFGCCIKCGEKIDPDRLAAQPAASRCIRCQESVDRDAQPTSGLQAHADVRFGSR